MAQLGDLICSGTSRFLNDIYTKGIKSTNFQYDADTPSVTVGTRSSGTVGSYSFTAGQNNIASNSQSIAVGYGNTSSNSQTFACGNGNTASAAQAFVCGNGNTASGNYSHAEGSGCTASGWYTHAEGQSTTASTDAAHAEGCSTQASGSYSHAEGHSTKALSNYSHAEGYGCEASTGAWYQHAEGQETKAGGNAGHAEGCGTVTAAHYSHAEGLGTYAGSQAQHVFGKYNTKDTSGTYVEIVGNGSADDARSYARRLSWTGNEELAGTLTATDVIKTAKWDGTNTSLATALSNKLSLSGGTITGAITSTQTATQSVMIPATADGGMFGTFDYPYRAFWATRLCASAQSNNRYLKMTGTDITFASTVSGDATNTWDGTNASLKDAITAIYLSTLCYSASISRGSGWTQRSTSTAFPSSTTGTYLFMIKDSNGTIYSRMPIPAADFAGTTSTRPLIVRSNGTSSDANNIMTYWSSTTKFYTYAGSSSMPTGTFTLVIHYTPLNI